MCFIKIEFYCRVQESAYFLLSNKLVMTIVILLLDKSETSSMYIFITCLLQCLLAITEVLIKFWILYFLIFAIAIWTERRYVCFEEK